MNDKCYVYDCSNRNYHGYCKTTVCINPKYKKITNSTRDAADIFVAKPVTNADRIRSMTDEELNRRIDRAIELYNRNVEKSAMYEALAGISPEPQKEETCTKN